jgi:LacI family transcriptional regulator
MKATLKDVAKLAEVDIGSVSRTLSGHPRANSLRAETRERIFEAAKKLGYRRNVFASAMRTGVNRTVAVINSGSASGTTSSALRILSGIIQGASDASYALKTYLDSDLPAVMEDILSNQILQVICMTPIHGKREETATLCRQHGLKLVFVYETAHGEFPAVTANNFEISRDVVQYLASMGHRRIALVCGEYPHWHYMTEKYHGYLAGLRESGIEPQFNMMICNDFPIKEIQSMLDRPAEVRPTAFFCIGDSFAMQVQSSAVRRGLRLPEDISTTGFGFTFSGEDALSPLSSVNENHALIGKSAFQLLLGVSLDFPQDPDGTYRVPGTFVKRESVMNLNADPSSIPVNDTYHKNKECSISQ